MKATRGTSLAAVLGALAVAGALAAQEPELPQGLEPAAPQPSQQPELPQGLGGVPSEPGLPEGLGGVPQEPQLPTGLEGGEVEPSTAPDAADAADPWHRLGLKGFFDVRAGTRITRDPYGRTASLGEARLRLEWERAFDPLFVRVAGDLVADTLQSSWTPELETGRGFVDLREAFASTTPLPFLDVKVGRQVLTWGTGDLLFVNDLFPKDWVSFFVGRDTEYLKAPSDAVRVGAYGDLANLEIVYTPRFDPDRYLRGDRISFYNPLLGRRSGRDAVLDPIVPDDPFADDEVAARLSSNVDGLELAAYGYSGRWKSPFGFDANSGAATFPRLAVYGASARTQLGGGIANAEFGYYDSRQDRGGDDPLVPNSELRVLFGYERDLPELADSLTVAVQYYLEATMDYGAFRATLPASIPAREEVRHVVTVRVTRQLVQQRLRLSLFGYVSPNDEDAYLRGGVSYTIDDSWSVSAGTNVFFGQRDHTFFGQLENNSNVWLAARYSF